MDEFVDILTPDELLSRYSLMVYRLAYARVRNVHDAQDITQEVFLRYMRQERHFSSEEHRKAWLIRVTVNAGKTLVTSAWFRHRASADDDEAAQIAVEMPEESGVYSAVQSLAPKYREVVHLFYYEELSITQISSTLKIKESTVKSLLHRARAMLKETLKEEYYEL